MMAMFKSQKERMVGGCKRHMAISNEEGSAKLQQCGNQAEREKEGKKWQGCFKAVWGTIREQITDGCAGNGNPYWPGCPNRTERDVRNVKSRYTGPVRKSTGEATRIGAMYKGFGWRYGWSLNRK